jgi:predicted CopG family antitoxin
VGRPQEPIAPLNILIDGSRRARLARDSMLASGDGGAVSTVIENLLSRKQKLVEQLEKAQSVEDRDKIEHQLEQINTALDFLDRPGSKGGR